MKHASIVERLDYTLELMATKGMKARAIYLNEEDREELAAIVTHDWRELTGSDAFLWPSTYKAELIVNEKGVQALEKAELIPLRKGNGLRNQSTIYSIRGVGVCIRKRVP